MSTSPVSVVIGPKTRLGRELISGAVARGESVVAVARHDADATALTGSGAQVVLASDATDLAGRDLQILVCALGPIHPAEPGTAVDPEADAASVDRDLDTIAALIDAASSATVVLVSTVIALAPGADRRYYGGWKAVVERALLERAHDLGAQVSVLYPGRLVDSSAATRPWHRLYTRYSRLAEIVRTTAAAASPRFRVVGADARLWLALRGLSVMLGSVSGSAGTPSSLTAHPRTTSEEITL